MATLSDQLRGSRRIAYGREPLVVELVASLRAPAPLVTFITGIPGAGKSTVLRLASDAARTSGAAVIELDCGAIEPTDLGVLDALSRAVRRPIGSLEEVSPALEALGEPLLLTLDGYEAWRLIDTWVCREFILALPPHARVFVGSRYRPPGPWRFEPEWRHACRVIELDPLAPSDAVAFLESEGLSPEASSRINAIVRGHPLALALVVGGLRDDSTTTIEATAAEAVTEALADIFVTAVASPRARAALEAASVTRRSTVPLLEAQLGSPEAAAEAYTLLGQLPFVHESWDGLFVHDAVKQAGAARLRASDPVRHRDLRRAA